MANAIVPVYGEDRTRQFTPKPADYTTLVPIAHAKFRELDGFAKDNIVVHFTPE